MKKFLFLFFLVITITASAQNLRFRKGIVLDSIAMVRDTLHAELQESYAIFLPSNFDVNKKWPLIFIFDPDGDGKKGVKLFSEAAEKYGYILVGSNNIKEGKIAPNLATYNRLSEEILNIFPVHPSRIYTAGFSGGARLASSIAVLSDGIAGVIACGAGFSSAYPPKKNKFFFVGISGETDFNLIELLNTTTFLKRMKFDTEHYIVEGGHAWPPSSVILKTIQDIELKLKTKNTSDEGGDFVKESYQSDYNYVRALLAERKPSRAIEELKRMQKNYRFNFNTDSLVEIEKTIKRDKILKTVIASNRRALNEERTIRLNYLEYFIDDLDTIFMDNLGWWEAQNAMLDDYIKGSNKARQKMGKRLKSMLYTLGKERLESVDINKQVDKALFLHIFITLADPAAYDSYLGIMQISTKEGNYEMGLYYAEQLFKNGFKDKNKLYGTDGLSTLRISPEFRELVRKYL